MYVVYGRVFLFMRQALLSGPAKITNIHIPFQYSPSGFLFPCRSNPWSTSPRRLNSDPALILLSLGPASSGRALVMFMTGCQVSLVRCVRSPTPLLAVTRIPLTGTYLPDRAFSPLSSRPVTGQALGLKFAELPSD